MTAMLPALQATLGGRIIDHDGDQRLHLGDGFIYCGLTGKIRLQLDGRIYDLGRMTDSPETVVRHYCAAVAGVAAVTQ